jgi:hypothetical protein
LSNGCKANNTLIISKVVKVGVKGARALVTHANSTMRLDAKFCPN